MALDLAAHQSAVFGMLRFTPTTKRLRASYDGVPVLDTTDALVVWEPRRVVPMYAVPRADVLVPLTPAMSHEPPPDLPPVIGPGHFDWHWHEGQPFTVEVAGRSLEAVAFVAADPDLGGRVILDWSPFEWMEEEEPVTGHPHDPFKRLDVLRSGRHVVVSAHGQVLADTTHAVAIYETHLPVRWYVPRGDVRTELLEPSEGRSTCAYKGHARYFSLAGGEEDDVDIAWTYEEPLHEVEAVRGHVCFYAERTDLVVDGEEVPRPDTFWRSRKSSELA